MTSLTKTNLTIFFLENGLRQWQRHRRLKMNFSLFRLGLSFLDFYGFDVPWPIDACSTWPSHCCAYEKLFLFVEMCRNSFEGISMCSTVWVSEWRIVCTFILVCGLSSGEHRAMSIQTLSTINDDYLLDCFCGGQCQLESTHSLVLWPLIFVFYWNWNKTQWWRRRRRRQRWQKKEKEQKKNWNKSKMVTHTHSTVHTGNRRMTI